MSLMISSRTLRRWWPGGLLTGMPLLVLVAVGMSMVDAHASGVVRSFTLPAGTGSRIVTHSGQAAHSGDLVGDSVFVLDAAGQRRWQIVAARDPVSGRPSPFSIAPQMRGLVIVPSDPTLLPTVVDLNEVLLEVRPLLGDLHGREAAQASAADLDGDGRADLAFLDSRTMPLPPYDTEHRISLMLSTVMPRGVVDLVSEEPDAVLRRTAGHGTWSGMWASDVDGDGYVDLVAGVSDSIRAGAHFEVFRGPFPPGDRRDVDLSPPDAIWAGLSFADADRAQVGDLDGDGLGDLVFTERDAASRPQAMVAVFGTRPLAPSIDVSDVSSPHVLRILFDVPGSAILPFGLIDFDGDGRDEIVHEDRGFISLVADGVRAPGLTAVSLLPLPYRLAAIPPSGGWDPRPIPSACGHGEAILVDSRGGVLDGIDRNGMATVFEPRPRDFWQLDPAPAPDQVIVGPPIVRSLRVDFDAFVFADLDGDGFRDVALGNTLAADGTMTTPGNGVIVARSMGAVQPEVSIFDESASLQQLPGPDMTAFGNGIRVGDFDADGINDLVAFGDIARTPLFGVVRVFKGKRWVDVPDGAGCAELVSVAPGSSVTTSPATADAPVAAWGRVDQAGRAFDPVMQVEPVRAPAMPGDPVLGVDGGQLAASLHPAVPTGVRGAYRGRLARAAAGPIVADVPAAADAMGAHLLCLDPRHRAPLVLAGPDQVLTIASGALDCSPAVTIAGATHDQDCDEVTAWWEEAGVVVADTLSASLRLGVGIHELTLFAQDAFDIASDSLTIEVVDAIPPRFAATAPVACLWPPNHRLVDIHLGHEVVVDVSDNCDPAPAVRIVDVMSSEPEDDLGDGHTTPDVVMISDDHVKIRRERSGLGIGRTYTIMLEAADASGNATTATVEFLVPHDQSDRRCLRRNPASSSRRAPASTRRPVR